MSKEKWLVVALAYMIRIFGRSNQQGIIVHTLLPGRRIQRVDWRNERRGVTNWGGRRREVGWWWLGSFGDD